MKRWKMGTILYWVLAFVPLIVTAICYPAFPETIPAHYNLYGEVDRWGSRVELFILPAIIPPLAVLFWGLLELTKKAALRQGETKRLTSERVLAGMRFAILIFFDLFALTILFTTWRTLQESGGSMSLDLYRLMTALLSVMEIVIGNLLPKVRQNGVFGIRTPWTLRSEEVWYRTHRFGGKVMLGSGILGLLAVFLCKGWPVLAVYLGITVCAAVVMVVYSWKISRQDEN